MDEPEPDIVKTRLPRSQKKKLKRQQKLERIKQRRPEVKRRRKEVLRIEREKLLSSMTEDEKEEYILNLRKSKYEKAIELSKFLDESYENGLPICINCSFEDSMDAKEIRSLAKQISLCYNIIKKHMVPIKLILTSFSKESTFYKECELFGVHKWKIHIEEKAFWDVFDKKDIVVLSPDATEHLEEISPDKVYVIGGLVDTNVKKFHVLNQAESYGISCKSLPIKKYIPKCKKTVLNVSTVFEILSYRINNLSWEDALTRCLPIRSLN